MPGMSSIFIVCQFLRSCLASPVGVQVAILVLPATATPARSVPPKLLGVWRSIRRSHRRDGGQHRTPRRPGLLELRGDGLSLFGLAPFAIEIRKAIEHIAAVLEFGPGQRPLH